jgi:hypothetical protein
VALNVETQGAEHSERLVGALRNAGYRPHFG